jgi:hypothetical protein
MLTLWHKIIAISQIVGGGLGLISIGIFIVKPPSIAAPAGMYLYSPIVFGATLVAGILLLKRNIWGYRMSLALQSVQIIQISTAFTYNISLGLQVLLVFGGSWFRLSPGFNVAAWIGKSLVGTPTFVAVNAFSLVALIYLLSSRWRIFEVSCQQ